MIGRAESNSEGIFDLVLGLPVHPLVVHAAVVLVPLAAIAAIAMAVKSSVSKKYGKVIIGLAIVGQISSIVAKLSGEVFLERLNIELERHAQLGDTAPLTSLPMLALIVLLYRFDKSSKKGGIRKIVAIATVVSAIFAAGYIAVTGHSGAEAVWSWVQFN